MTVRAKDLTLVGGMEIGDAVRKLYDSGYSPYGRFGTAGRVYVKDDLAIKLSFPDDAYRMHMAIAMRNEDNPWLQKFYGIENLDDGCFAAYQEKLSTFRFGDGKSDIAEKIAELDNQRRVRRDYNSLDDIDESFRVLLEEGLIGEAQYNSFLAAYRELIQYSKNSRKSGKFGRYLDTNPDNFCLREGTADVVWVDSLVVPANVIRRFDEGKNADEFFARIDLEHGLPLVDLPIGMRDLDKEFREKRQEQ